MRNLPHNELNSPVSTNTVLHFTRRFEVLTEIISTGFRAFSCKEFPAFLRTPHEQQVLNDIFSIETEPIEDIPIPMVCFCDTPKRIRFNHMRRYGHYGIELTKKWAINRMISPVCYTPADTKTNNTLNAVFTAQYRVITELNKIKDDGSTDVEFALGHAYTGFFDMMKYLSFIKDYQDQISKVKYYDEREWRYVPEEGREDELLTFNFDDIVAIYVRSAKERRIVRRIIMDRYGKDMKDAIVVSNRK